MYGFVYNQYNDIRGIMYDGNPENLKYCKDPEEAKARWKENESYMVEHTMKLYAGKYLKIKVPVRPGVKSNQFTNRVMALKISPIVQQLIAQLLDEFDPNDDGTFQRRELRGKEEVDGVLMHMRDIIEGIFRISPIKIVTSTKRADKKTTIDYPLGQSLYTPVGYTVAGKRYKTPLFGLYTSSVRKLMFPMSDFDGGNTLQRWQRDSLFKRGQNTYIIAARESGKSMNAAAFVGNYLFRELCFPSTDLLRGLDINYYGQSNSGNKSVYNYVKSMIIKFMQGSTFVKFDDAKQIITFFDDGIKRELNFISQLAEAKGRGGRPALNIVDEASRILPEIYEIVIGTAGVPAVYISTVNSTTRKNWFWDKFCAAERDQRSYEPLPELIHRLWIKYGMDKVTCDEDVRWHIDNNTFQKMREEFYLARPNVALRYTIDDVDETILSPGAKDAKIKAALTQGEKFLMAEYYGYYIDEEDVFNPDGLIVADIPKMFEHITIGYDPAQDFDNPAICAVGMLNDIVYTIDSRVLSPDTAIQTREIRDFRKEMQSRSQNGNYVYLGADVTRGKGELALLEDRDIWVDYPIKYTKGVGVNFKGREHLIGKEFIVKLAREQYFWKNAVRIWDKLSNENGLIDELVDFKHKANGKWEAATGKDDQVNAFMMALYMMYDIYMKDVFVQMDSAPVQRIGSLREMIKAEEETDTEKYTGMITYWN